MTPQTPAILARRRAAPAPTVAELARGATALVMALALLFGVPTALWALGRALSPFKGLHASTVASALTRPDDGSLFLATVLLVAWAAWLVMAVSIALEVVAFVRRTPTPRLPLLRLPQQGAAALVATAALLVTSGTTLVPGALARPVAAAALDLPSHPELSAPSPRTAIIGTQETDALRRHPTVVVQRHDTLWSLAETHLGSGERFREIVALNRDRPQPDGRALTNSHWVYPGWTLRLPLDARTTSEPPEHSRGETSDSAERYTVERGDTLWEIAAAELGDGHRYGEVFQLNDGRAQPDGLTLSDADEIRPGWRLTLPATNGIAATTDRVVTPLPSRPRMTSPPEQPDAALGESRTAPAATPPASHVAGPETTGAVPEDSDSAVQSLVLGLGAVAATGLAWELRRRRRLQQRRRRLGDRIAMPDPETTAVEACMTSNASPVTVESVRDALRALRASCRAVQRPLPDVVLVRVSSSSVELELHGDDPDAVPPFAAVTARTWRLDGPTQADPDQPDPYPALVALGVDGADLLLLNLESVGTLHLDGPKKRVAGVLRALALDLAVGPLSDTATLTLVGCFPELARDLDPGRARHVASTQQVEREIGVRTAAIQKLLAASGAKDVRAARSLEVAVDATVPEVVVADGPLSDRPTAWSGVSAVVGDAAADGWVVVLDAVSGATLNPLGIPFDPQTLAQGDFDHVVSLLATAQADAVAPRTTVEGLDERAVVASALPEVSENVVDLREDMPAPPRVLVLGKVHVERADDQAAPYRRRRATELIAYLALHPGASAHEIDEALWPGKRVDKTTRNPFISRARQWLGRTPDGEPYLPLVVDGGSYVLRSDVSCDWHDFVRLAELGLGSGPEGVDALEAALSLVRGRPFLGVDPATYTWAEADAQEMISAVVDVAHVLSVTRYDDGDYRGAEEAAAKGLLAEPCSELLYRDAIRAAAAAGDRVEVQRLAGRLRHEISLVDPDETLDEITAELIAAAVGS